MNIVYLNVWARFVKYSMGCIIIFILSSMTVLHAENKHISAKYKNLSPQEQIEIKGVLIDNNNAPLIGATVVIKGTTIGVVSDINGNYSLLIPGKNSVVQFSYIGYKTHTITYNGKNINDFRVVTLIEDVSLLDEVQTVAFATQKKESVVSAITTINPSELKVPSSNLTAALAGRVAGLISYQRSGEPGADNAEFFIRGVTSFGYSASPLILIDGLELTVDDLARLNTDDIESFSILKDATSSALYGARGANGVILVTTKTGDIGGARLSFRFENSISGPGSSIDIVEPIDYMRLHNEATLSRDPLAEVPYSQMKIDNTIRGLNSNVYPAVDWHDMLFKDFTNNQRFNMNLSGGGKVARYYISADYVHDTGLLKVDERNNFNQNININRVNVRSNVNLVVTKTTDIAVRLTGSFDDYTGPVSDATGIYNMVMQTNPVLYPAYYDADEENKYTKNILFGNNEEANGMNPYAEMVKGYRNSSRAFLSMQIELKQKLDFITEGLSVRINANTDRTSTYASSRSYKPYYYNVGQYNKLKDTYILNNTNRDDAASWLTYTKGDYNISSAVYMEAAINYNRTFADKHDVTGLFVYTMRNRESFNSKINDLQQSLPYRNLGIAGRLTYGYDSRFFVEANFGYNGSERFAKKNRFGFFPSMGVGYMLSNENFFQDNVNPDKLTQVKLKATYGLVGNDAIGAEEDRFFYISKVSQEGDRGTTPGFGTDLDYSHGNLTVIERYANEDITWEVARKLDIGIEATIFRDFKLIADYFREDRSNILMNRSSITPEVGFQAAVKSNIGEAFSHGFDGSIDYNKFFTNGLWVQGRANITYAVGTFKVYEEQLYPDAPYKSRIGQPLNQQFGYIAERLFIDQYDIDNSPEQFGDYLPGDIKYSDVNGDGIINEKDMVPLGFPTAPEIMYGFGFSAGYKGFDMSAFFQGSGRSSFWSNHHKDYPHIATAPFIDMNNDFETNNAMLQVYADDYWSESNQNPYAKWPRLSTTVIDNNAKPSSWFMQDGSFLRLKNLEVGYTFNKKMLERLHVSKLRIYATGSNLLTFSKFKLWDPEMAGNGLGYPIQRVYNFGLQIGF